VLFRLDDSNEKAAVGAAEARLAQAKAELADLKTGKRDQEIAVLEAQLNAARANLASASDDYDRQLVLREKNVVPQATVDSAKAKRDAAAADVDAAARQLEVGELPARPDTIEAGERNVAALAAALDQARIALDRRTVRAPASGLVEETFFEPGELVAAGQPVVSLLPEANRKLRFYVPETMLAKVALGAHVAVSCDGCAAGLAGTVTFVASQAEFTPPIIYSKESRAKLVFRVEARPEGAAAALKVGQPIDVRLGAAGTPGT
jgi:HlyD family secretion protein